MARRLGCDEGKERWPREIPVKSAKKVNVGSCLPELESLHAQRQLASNVILFAQLFGNGGLWEGEGWCAVVCCAAFQDSCCQISISHLRGPMRPTT